MISSAMAKPTCRLLIASCCSAWRLETRREHPEPFLGQRQKDLVFVLEAHTTGV